MEACRGEMNWKEIPLPALQNVLSTGEAQPLNRNLWPEWAQSNPRFSGGWFTPVDGVPAMSTGTLSTGSVVAYVDMERTASESPRLRYYRFLYGQVTDGRVFQAGPIKELEYERHRDERPPWLGSLSTGPGSA